MQLASRFWDILKRRKGLMWFDSKLYTGGASKTFSLLRQLNSFFFHLIGNKSNSLWPRYYNFNKNLRYSDSWLSYSPSFFRGIAEVSDDYAVRTHRYGIPTLQWVKQKVESFGSVVGTWLALACGTLLH